MAVKWNCDNCGTETQVNPPYEEVFEEKVVETEVPSTYEDKLGKKKVKWEKKRVKKKVPKMGKMRRQNPFTGSFEEIDVPQTRPKVPRTIIVSLNVGGEAFQRDFCEVCYKEKVSKEVESLFSKLKEFESK